MEKEKPIGSATLRVTVKGQRKSSHCSHRVFLPRPLVTVPGSSPTHSQAGACQVVKGLKQKHASTYAIEPSPQPQTRSSIGVPCRWPAKYVHLAQREHISEHAGWQMSHRKKYHSGHFCSALQNITTDDRISHSSENFALCRPHYSRIPPRAWPSRLGEDQELYQNAPGFQLTRLESLLVCLLGCSVTVGSGYFIKSLISQLQPTYPYEKSAVFASYNPPAPISYSNRNLADVDFDKKRTRCLAFEREKSAVCSTFIIHSPYGVLPKYILDMGDTRGDHPTLGTFHVDTSTLTPE